MSPLLARSEHGAILVQTAIAMLTLLGIAMFVIDYGVYWVSRGQAQNAADAGAIAGAIARAYDDFSDPPDPTGPVAAIATQVASANPVWNGPGVPLTASSSVVTFGCPPDVAGGQCVKVAVYRNGTAGSSPLPWIFGSALAMPTSQGVQASATAQVRVGNATDCLRPFAIPDRWTETIPVGAPDNIFEAYTEPGGAPLVPGDQYIPPTDSDPGTGMQWPGDLGAPLTLTFDAPAANGPISPGKFLPLDFPGVPTYDENIASCYGAQMAIGDQPLTSVSATSVATDTALNDLIARDPGATWNAATNKIDGSCAPAACGPISPRLIAIALYNVDSYQRHRATADWSTCPTSAPCVEIVNMVGFFLDTMVGPGTVSGYLTAYPGLISTTATTVSSASSFMKAVTLVR